MENRFVYLLGPPGVGKYTVGKLLAAQMPARLVDNHYWNNPIFEILEPDGKTRLPMAVWDRTNAVRTAVLETIATLSPAGRNFVFTHAISRGRGHPMDLMIAGQILNTAERRDARTLVVHLSCGAPQLASRLETPSRAERLKERGGERAAIYAAQESLPLDHAWQIAIDTTDLQAEETAAQIMQALRAG